jgi:hypothetical protein
MRQVVAQYPNVLVEANSLWGRLVTCGRLLIGLLLVLSMYSARHPAPAGIQSETR